VLDRVPIDILQFHGKESPERVAARARFRRSVMKAIAIAGPEDVLAASRYEDQADMLLFDASRHAAPMHCQAATGSSSTGG
jgi:phosphoribosylanthranilate isomerase